MAWFDVNLYDLVKDCSAPPTLTKKTCKYEGCSTILNQDNLKRGDYCYVCQRKVSDTEYKQNFQRKLDRYNQEQERKKQLKKGKRDE